MTHSTLKIACEGAATVALDQLKEFQGDLKTLNKEPFEMLKKELVQTGFAFPFHVWKDPQGQLNLIGGHQRKRVIHAMEQEGWVIPPLPVVWVKAKNLQEAKRRVLQDVAQYGKVEGQGLYEFVHEFDLDVNDLATSFRLPDIRMPEFLEEYFGDGGVDPLDVGLGAPALPSQQGSASGAVRMVQLYYKQEDHEMLMRLLDDLGGPYGTDNLSDTIMEAVKRAHAKAAA